ncbi:MAG TPA: hypothetical protein VEW04_03080 [Allosphingosinicella sp.]|nr:hypothetical protein [Allosphingosinicella sp.]
MSWIRTIAPALAVLAAAPLGAQPPANPAPATLLAENPDELQLQDAASVVRIDELRRQGALGGKLFGTAGGDPAMNGLYTYLAFFVSPAEGWRVFEIGDFLTYRIVSETPGRVLLEVRENVMNGAGEIGERSRRIALSWTAGANRTPPESVRLTPGLR